MAQIAALRIEQREAVAAHNPLEDEKKAKQRALDDLKAEVENASVTFCFGIMLMTGCING